MFKKIHRKKIEKIIEKALLKRDASQLNAKVQSVAFLFDEQIQKEVSFYKPIANVFSISTETIEYLAFVTFDKKKPSLEHQFTKKDFSWQGKINSEKIERFIQKEVDVLVCYYKGDHEYLDLISAKSNAAFKIGFKGNDERIADLILALDPLNVDTVAQEIKKYLAILGKI
ncbi:DUF6913 domain-containing protein [Patiriisocius sp. Uisw_017]|jgi:hypothetical protein|uniref:DUF6913 domain-containing protein n=1 Tax=Patiriisocius sp. Uisw_017 TaxID=3230968 RepID=UPI0039EB5764